MTTRIQVQRAATNDGPRSTARRGGQGPGTVSSGGAGLEEMGERLQSHVGARRVASSQATFDARPVQGMFTTAPATTPGVVQRARDTALIGTELSFTNPELYGASKAGGGAIDTPVARQYLDAWNKVMSSVDIVKTSSKDTPKGPVYHYTFPSGWWYQISIDAGALETQVRPFTEGELGGEIGAWIHKFVFGTAKKIGLQADSFVGGGHINLDIATTFDNDATLFRNFLDVYDQLFASLSGLDPDLNATSFSQLQGDAPRTWKDFVLRNFREGETTIPELAKSIRENVHTRESLPPEFVRRLEGSAVREFLGSWGATDLAPLLGELDVSSVEKVDFGSLRSILETEDQTELDGLLTYKIQHNQATNVQHILGGERKDGGSDRLELRRFSAQPNLETLRDEIALVMTLLEGSKGKAGKMDMSVFKGIPEKVGEIRAKLEAGQSDVSAT